MTKQLIYKDITKVLYMMNTFDIRFLTHKGDWIVSIETSIGHSHTVDFEDAYKPAINHTVYSRRNGKINCYKTFEFRVHPDDVAKFEPASGDVCKGMALVEQSCVLYNFVVPINKENQFRIERIDYIRERDGKAWLSPCEVRDATD